VAVEGLSIRLLLDHHIDERLITDLGRDGFDVTNPRELGTERARDDEHLRWAATHGRAILTSDVKDFPDLGRTWIRQGRDHAGIILVEATPRVSYGELLRRLRAFLDAVSAEEMVNQVRWLDESWTRRA
jgi:predicted nuclease of predicted toxin-antitoxin system